MTSYEDRLKAATVINGAIVCLASAGTLLLKSRVGVAGADDMITALRDDIQTMIGDVEALRELTLKGDT